MNNVPQSPEEVRRLQELSEMNDEERGPLAGSVQAALPAGRGDVRGAFKHWGGVLAAKARQLGEATTYGATHVRHTLTRRADEFRASHEVGDVTSSTEGEGTESAGVGEAAVEPVSASFDIDRLPRSKEQALSAVVEEPALSPGIAIAVDDMPEPPVPNESITAGATLQQGGHEPGGHVRNTADPISVPQTDHSHAEKDAAAAVPVAVDARSGESRPGQRVTGALSKKVRWKFIAGASAACLLVVGAVVGGIVRSPGNNETEPTTEALPAGGPPAQALTAPPLEVEETPSPSAAEPASLPAEAVEPVVAHDQKSAEPSRAEVPEAKAEVDLRVEANGANAASKIGSHSAGAAKPRAVEKRTAVRPAPTKSSEMPRGITTWQEKADSDIDAWAKKAGIN